MHASGASQSTSMRNPRSSIICASPPASRRWSVFACSYPAAAQTTPTLCCLLNRHGRAKVSRFVPQFGRSIIKCFLAISLRQTAMRPASWSLPISASHYAPGEPPRAQMQSPADAVDSPQNHQPLALLEEVGRLLDDPHVLGKSDEVSSFKSIARCNQERSGCLPPETAPLAPAANGSAHPAASRENS